MTRDLPPIRSSLLQHHRVLRCTMDVKSILFGVLVLICVESGICLKCYVCDSRVDSQCGVTFEVASPMKYEVTCKSNAIGCKKSVADMIDNMPKLVLRECYNDTSTVNQTYVPDTKKCREDWGLTSCFCKGDLCNGQSTLIVNVSLFIGLLTFSAFFTKYFS